jgi:hypothetical protein
MNSLTVFRPGTPIRFQSHDQGEVPGIIVAETNPHAIDFEREFTILYRSSEGEPCYDPLVAESWIKPVDGYVAPADREYLWRHVLMSVQDYLPEVLGPHDE